MDSTAQHLPTRSAQDDAHLLDEIQHPALVTAFDVLAQAKAPAVDQQLLDQFTAQLVVRNAALRQRLAA